MAAKKLGAADDGVEDGQKRGTDGEEQGRPRQGLRRGRARGNEADGERRGRPAGRRNRGGARMRAWSCYGGRGKEQGAARWR